MAAKEPKYGKEEFARLGEQIYERDIYPVLQPDSKGKIVAIDIITGAWEIDASEIAACQRLEERQKEAQVWIKRVGYNYVRKFGAGRTKQIA
ncbi:hypothetical protein NIES4071_52150 [Calothrix sp. NIES-4071]|nr:hypothetical protein NIES4071_52150 [Calothrix sp. NIES-4071]BAZ59523.1 hypothetical protein NIES4105_52100 [Calothrix sp. NIES-4105]